MQQKTQQNEQDLTVKISRAAMEEELGQAYKRCWAIAFKIAGEGLDIDAQIETLCREFDLIKPQAEWFIKGANSILRQKEQGFKNDNSKQPVQRGLLRFSIKQTTTAARVERYVSQLEMMSFLEDVSEMSQNAEFAEFWEDLKTIQNKVLEQQCATEKEVLRVFKIRSMVQRKREENERFFDAYPVSTDAWENGHFDAAGEIFY